MSTCSNADVVCYSATWRAELNDVHVIVDGLTKNYIFSSYDKTDEAQSFARHSNMQPRVHHV